MSTKTSIVDRSAEMKAAATKNPQGALAFTFMSAFGFNLEDAMMVFNKIVGNNHWHMIAVVMAASVQIRQNVVFIGEDWKGIKNDYPEFVIVGRSDAKDRFNFSAMHIVGHLVCNFATKSKLAQRALRKGGDCITGNFCPENVAGKVNSEIAGQWSRESKNEVLNSVRLYDSDVLSAQVDALEAMAKEFAKQFMVTQEEE
jgi:hypothetical protein